MGRWVVHSYTDQHTGWSNKYIYAHCNQHTGWPHVHAVRYQYQDCDADQDASEHSDTRIPDLYANDPGYADAVSDCYAVPWRVCSGAAHAASGTDRDSDYHTNRAIQLLDWAELG